MDRMATGRLGEQAVMDYLCQRGYTVVEHNYHATKGGHEEIDIIACDGKFLAFVEVKTRKKDSMLPAMSAITLQKRRRIVSGAQNYLITHAESRQYQPRFDVACVVTEKGKVLSIDYYKNAFTLCDI